MAGGNAARSWAAKGERPLRQLERGPAAAILLLLVAAMAWSSWAVPRLARADAAHEAQAHAATAIGDFELYSRINARVAAGENYYAAALDEQRANNYPTRPFVTVRLPTLAWANAIAGQQAMGVLAIVLLLANLAAWHRKLGEGSLVAERIAGVTLIFLSGIGAFEPRAGLIHELVAGLLLSLALGMMGRGRWIPSLLVAALALAVRELALPFLLLWLVFALVQRQRIQAVAIASVIALFAVGLWFHAEAVAAHSLPGDRPSPGWAGLAGPQMALYALSRLSALLLLPLAVAAPLALLPLVGWLSRWDAASAFASLWFAGFFVMLALLARPANFYWVLLVLPAYFAGMALMPRAIGDLLHAVRRTPTSQS